MSRQHVTEKREKSLAEIVIIVLMVSILMMSFIHYFFKQEEQLTTVGFNTLAQNFSTKVTTVRAQWFMDKQPDMLTLVTSSSIQKIYMNKKGWVDSNIINLACEQIWKVVMTESLNLMNMEITATEIAPKAHQMGRICEYRLPSGEYFEYNSADGKVSTIKQVNDSS